MNNEILEILNELEKNTNDILLKDKSQQEKINELENKSNDLLTANLNLKEEVKLLLKENSELKEEIEILKSNQKVDIEEPKEPIESGDNLLKNLNEIEFKTENALQYEIKNNNLILQGNSRYANIRFKYIEKEEDCIPNILGKYILHLEGYKEVGCNNSYINTASNAIQENEFNIDLQVSSSWQRIMNISIFLNGTVGEISKMVITSIKLTKAE